MDVAANPQQVQSRIGYMPQKFGLYGDLSVQENLDLYADLHGVGADERKAALSAADGDDRAGAVRQTFSRAALGGNEAEAWPRLHAHSITGTAAAR